MSQVDIPSSEKTVDVLKQAYLRYYPNVFEGKEREASEKAYARIGKIKFADYWSDIFIDFRDKYSRNPAGHFAQEIFKAAEKLDGDDLNRAIAEKLADFGSDVLEAGLKMRSLPKVDEKKLSGLAAFLNTKRDELEGSAVILSAQPRDISDDWVRFAAQLAETNSELHKAILDEVTPIWTNVELSADEEMEIWEEMMGGYSIFDKMIALQKALAAVFARHFPEIVIGKLKKAPRYRFQYKNVKDTRDKVEKTLG